MPSWLRQACVRFSDSQFDQWHQAAGSVRVWELAKDQDRPAGLCGKSLKVIGVS